MTTQLHYEGRKSLSPHEIKKCSISGAENLEVIKIDFQDRTGQICLVLDGIDKDKLRGRLRETNMEIRNE